MGRFRNMAENFSPDDELLPEYDESVFKDAVRGKYAERCAERTSIVRLAPDVAADVPRDPAENDAVRLD